MNLFKITLIIFPHPLSNTNRSVYSQNRIISKWVTFLFQLFDLMCNDLVLHQFFLIVFEIFEIQILKVVKVLVDLILGLECVLAGVHVF